MFDQPLAAEYNGHAEIHPNKTGEFPQDPWDDCISTYMNG